MVFIAIPRDKIFHYPGEIYDVLKSLFFRSEYTNEFNEKFARYTGTRYAFSISSGRNALEVIIKSLGIKKGDEIILCSYNFNAVPLKLLDMGIKPVFVDANKNDFTINPSLIEKSINKRTRAIIATHILGNLCDMDSIMRLARKHKLEVIEDACQAHGSLYKGKKAGNLGDIAFFSLDTTKPVNTFGGGVITTNDQRLYNKIMRLASRLKSPSKSYILKKVFFDYIEFILTRPLVFVILVWPILLFSKIAKLDFLSSYKKVKNNSASKNFRLSDIQSFIGIKQLDFLEKNISQRRDNIDYLKSRLKRKFKINFPNYSKSNYYAFIVKSKDKKSLSKKLLLHRIDSEEYFMQDCERIFDGKSSKVTSFIHNNTIKIPISYDSRREELDITANIINESE
jgi:dTDP-4-amino-4,6-dideoxygalactose transaminase